MNTTQRPIVSMPEKITGFECDIEIENVLFHIMLSSDAFLPSPALHALPHNHPVFEGHLLLSGIAEIITPGGIVRLEKNDFCLIPKQLYHHAREVESPISSIAFSFSFSKLKNAPQSAFDLHSVLKEKLITLNAPTVFERSFALAHALFALTEEMGRGAIGKANRLRIRASDLAFALLDLLCPNLRGEYQDSLSPATRQQRAIDYFFSLNYAKDVTISDLADSIYLSERQTNRVLLDLYGMTFKQKLIETRIYTAIQFLLSTDRPISEIAEKSGYRSAVGFHSAFRQVTGTTPAKFRSAARKAK